MMNIAGIIVSYIYFFTITLIAPKIPHIGDEGRRKFVHIMLSNWWFLVLIFFNNVIFASIVPISSFIINYLSLRKGRRDGLVTGLARNNEFSSVDGMLTYPIALLFMVLISFIWQGKLYIGGFGTLSLGYGDGFAAIIGQHFNFKPFYIRGCKKSLSGSFGMLAVSFLIIFIYGTLMGIPNMFVISLVLSIVGTLTEIISKSGYDNLTVPLLVTFTYILFWG